MAKFCAQCGAALREGAKFCAGCGSATGAPSPAQPPPSAAPPSAAPPSPPAPSPAGPAYLAPPPGASAPPPGAAASAAPGAGAKINLPPAPPLWGMQASMMKSGDRVCAKLEKSLPSSTPFGRAVHRMVRAAYLDQNTYREVAADPNLNTEAAICALAALFGGVVGPAFLAFVTGGLSLSWVLGLLAASAATFAAFVLTTALCAPFVVGRKVDPLALFRPIAYAQSPGVLCIIPIVGMLLGLWRLPTTIAAAKDSLGCDIGKAVVLLILGAIGGAVASALVGPLLMRSVTGF